jgi:hypothetical protein
MESETKVLSWYGLSIRKTMVTKYLISSNQQDEACQGHTHLSPKTGQVLSQLEEPACRGGWGL